MGRLGHEETTYARFEEDALDLIAAAARRLIRQAWLSLAPLDGDCALISLEVRVTGSDSVLNLTQKIHLDTWESVLERNRVLGDEDGVAGGSGEA